MLTFVSYKFTDFIDYNYFQWNLGVFIYKTTLCMNRDDFSFLFLIWMLFISCLITLGGTSSTLLNRNGEWTPPLTCSDCWRKLAVIHHGMLAVCFSFAAFIMLRYLPFIPNLLRVFIVNEC